MVNDNSAIVLFTVKMATRKIIYQCSLENKTIHIDRVKYTIWCHIQAQSFNSMTLNTQDL